MTASKIVMSAASGAGGAEVLDVDDVFSTHLYAGDGTNGREINNGIDLSGEGGMVWFKARTTAQNHRIFDTARGSDYSLITNGAGAQSDHGSGGLNSFDDDGFTLGNAVVNGSGIYGGDYASWTWRKATNWFDIVQYTGNNATQTINHNLGSVPGMIIVKRLNDAGNWGVKHRSIAATNAVFLNRTDQSYANSTYWGDTEPTSTQFTVGTTHSVNNAPYVAYLFAHHDGDGEFGPNSDQDIIKCGSFSTDSSGNATVNLGFEPQWLMVKTTSHSYGWEIYDQMRGFGVSGHAYLFPHLSNAEGNNTTGGNTQPTSTGFSIGGNYWGANVDLIYMAIRRGPLAEPESATDVFDVKTYTGSSNFTSFSGLSTNYVDATANFIRSGYGAGTLIWSRLTGEDSLKTWSTAAEGDTSDTAQWDFTDNKLTITGGSTGSTASTYVNYFWKRAPGYFDVCCYTGDGGASTLQNHNLGVVPEMIWIKRRNSTENWGAYHKALPSLGKQLYLNLNGSYTTGYGSHIAPTATQFCVGGNAVMGGTNATNASGGTYIAYLFATAAGVSKVGSTSHTGGASTDVDCGFSNGAKFVLAKRADSTGDWFVWDSVRGIVSGNDPYLLLNSDAAEVTSYDYIDPLSSGFSFSSSMNTGTYIFYAIAA